MSRLLEQYRAHGYIDHGIAVNSARSLVDAVYKDGAAESDNNDDVLVLHSNRCLLECGNVASTHPVLVWYAQQLGRLECHQAVLSRSGAGISALINREVKGFACHHALLVSLVADDAARETETATVEIWQRSWGLHSLS